MWKVDIMGRANLNEVDILTLFKIYYVKSLTSNPISMNQLHDNKFQVKFNKDE